MPDYKALMDLADDVSRQLEDAGDLERNGLPNTRELQTAENSAVELLKGVVLAKAAEKRCDLLNAANAALARLDELRRAGLELSDVIEILKPAVSFK